MSETWLGDGASSGGVGPYWPWPTELILDTDGGVDDAQALLMLIAAGRPPYAITTVYGNVSLEAATENVLAILATAGVHIEVHAGAAQPLVETQHRCPSRPRRGRPGRRAAPGRDPRPCRLGRRAVPHRRAVGGGRRG